MSKIPLYTQTSYDWHCNKNQPNKPYAVDLNVGTNEYIFGRTTPNNQFIVSTGLINDPKPFGIQMVGGKKKKKNKKGGGSSFKLMNDAGIYNEKNYMNNELIYNALSKSAELKGVNASFNNSMIDAQNNIVGGGKKKKTKSVDKMTKTKKTTTKPKKTTKADTKITKSKKTTKADTKISKSKKTSKADTKITKSKKTTTKTTKPKMSITKKISKTTNSKKTTKPKIKKEKSLKNKIKNLIKK